MHNHFEVCENHFEEKRERYTQFTVTSYSNYVGYFEDPRVKICLFELQFLLKIPHSYLFNLDGGIVY